MAKVSVQVKVPKRLRKDVEVLLGRVERDRAALKEIGDFVSNRIRSEGRRGKPYNKDRSFPALEKSTIENRKYLSLFNFTSDVFSPKRSNVTLTGQLWDSIGHMILKNTVFIQFFGKRDPYTTGPGGKLQKLKGPNKTNQGLADMLAKGIKSKNGLKKYVAFEASVIENDVKINKRINAIVKRYLRRALVKYRKSK
jgi:hypothetical protein